MRVSGWLPLAGTLGLCVRGSGVESPAVDGESPVRETPVRAIGVLPE